MQTFNYQGLEIKYQVEGKGKPIILLNGIMMTTLSWEPVAEPFRQNNTLIRLDMIDQGQSSKAPELDYILDNQADMVAAFIKHLGYEKVYILGISYGGYVALSLAARYPNLVDRMVLFNSTAYTNKRNSELFIQFMQAAKAGDPYQFYLTTIPQFYGPSFYETRAEWMKAREDFLINFFKNENYRMSIYRLAKSCLGADIRPKLKNITADTLIVSGGEDYLFPLPEQQELKNNISNSHLVTMPKVGHVSPYEAPVLFTSLAYGFFNNPTLEFKI